MANYYLFSFESTIDAINNNLTLELYWKILCPNLIL